ncbi:MAG: hypothetical protein ACRCVV_05145 [Shewanella sp.]
MINSHLHRKFYSLLGYVKHDVAGKNPGNLRNDKSRISIRTIHGNIPPETPQDRNSSIEPKNSD